MHRFGRQKHDGAGGCLTRNDVALGDVADMFFHIDLHGAPRCRSCRFIRGSGKGTIGFQRKFRIDADRPGR